MKPENEININEALKQLEMTQNNIKDAIKRKKIKAKKCSSMNVLLFIRDMSLKSLLTSILADNNYNVTVADNSVEAMRIINKNSTSFITDYKGFQILKPCFNGRNRSCVILSGNEDTDTIMKLENYPTFWVSSPVDFKVIIALIKQIR